MKTVRIGLIGCGWIGSEHGRNVIANPNAELAGVCDAKAERAAAFLAATGAKCPTYADYHELLASDVDAVIIASPNFGHGKMCLAAAEAGKHMYAEKPMAITLADCRAIRDAVRKAGVKYLIGYHRRLNPLYQYAKGLLDEGELGEPFMIESDYLHHVPGDWAIWEWLGKESMGGSLFHAGGGHCVDLIRYFCGDVVEVTAMKDVFLPRTTQVETEDTTIALFRFENGAIGKVQSCSGPISPFQFNFKLYGTKGSVLENHVWLDSTPRFNAPEHANDFIELPVSWIPDNVQGGISETWNKLMDHFVAMLTEDAECLNDVESAYKTSAACFAAVEAAKTRKVVSLKEIE